MTDIKLYDGKMLDLVRRTVAKDTNDDEFSQFIHICRATRLDPLRRQCYAFVFGKDDLAKRQMVVVTAIGGYRAIAARTGNYRPDDKTPRFTYDETLVGPANPLGIVKVEVSVFQHSHGAWHEIVAEAFWDDYAPVIQSGAGGFDWQETGQVYPQGHAKAGKPKFRKVPIGDVVATLDPTKPAWLKGRIMLPKCAEALALRKGWPDDFAGVEVEEEIDRRMVDITPSEMAEAASVEAKLALVGGKDAVTVQWDMGGQLERVSLGQLYDKAIEWSRAKDRTATEMRIWWNQNLPARTEYKAKKAGEYLEFHKAWMARTAAIEDQDAKQTEAA